VPLHPGAGHPRELCYRKGVMVDALAREIRAPMDSVTVMGT